MCISLPKVNENSDVADIQALNERLPDNLKNERLLGVCLHKNFGGYFSARTVVLTDTQIDENEWRIIEPVSLLKNQEEIIDLLVEMNTNWAEGKWRDFGEPSIKYSETAKRYFDAAPKDRQKVIEELRKNSR
ncbi:Oidioi.mRNA.OKI2018_I69.XSR.g15411.t2.cds [Oikopleura dioica]|uniref:Cyanocobalamin reductase / alkylcobalamin dealkylase n=1 Tax=Oikopleura dioica TaxID=34765 RepID=A0ABN7SEP7_OIKDI|nr:Oidioi.mRNA.OKI2018_I69.XSR.g15411.t2.cds [Oikopleura dioica]